MFGKEPAKKCGIHSAEFDKERRYVKEAIFIKRWSVCQTMPVSEMLVPFESTTGLAVIRRRKWKKTGSAESREKTLQEVKEQDTAVMVGS